MDKEYTPERYFFIYAFPCSYIILLKGNLTQDEYNYFEKEFLSGNAPSREILEKSFPAAFNRIKRLAKRMDKNYWDFDVIFEYWNNEHNRIIHSGEGVYGESPESFKDLCRINIGEVVDINNDRLLVQYNGNKRMVSKILVPDIQVGDRVKIHYAYAIEKVI
jgi:hypothetical protein